MTIFHRKSLLVVLFAFGIVGLPAFAKDESQDLSSLDLEQLLNIKVITVSKFAEKISDAPGMISVVREDELRRFAGMTLGEILERVAGLAASTASFTDRSMVAIRGDQTKINGGHVLFLINGRPTREILEGGLVGDLLESFPVGILERIEVIKGPGSVLYGSNAFSGVVNLITKKAQGNSLVVTALGAGGGGAAPSGQFTAQRGDFSLVGAGQFLQKPTWFTPCWSPISGLQNYDIASRGTGSYLGMNYKGFSAMSSFTEWRTSYIEGAVGRGVWRRGFADFGYSWKAAKTWDMSLNLTYTRATLDAIHYIPGIDRSSNDVVVEWTNVLSLGSRDRLTFGTLYNYIHGVENFYGVSPKIAIADGSQPGGAFYAQIDHDLLDTVKLIGGFQANKIGDISFNAVPRFGVIWHPVTAWSVKALYSQAFRAPSINETVLNYNPPSTTPGPSLLGNPNLLPEKVATVDIGLGYQSNHLQMSVGYFYSKQTDSIILDASSMAWKYVNLGEAMFHGVEWESKYYFNRNFFLSASAIYQRSHDGAGNRNVTPIANMGVKAGISYEVPKRFIASIFDVYQGDIYGYSESLNPRPDCYHLLNAHLRYDVSRYLRMPDRTGVALVAHADNLANTPIWLPDWKDRPGDTIFWNQGRTVYFGIEVALNKE